MSRTFFPPQLDLCDGGSQYSLTPSCDATRNLKRITLWSSLRSFEEYEGDLLNLYLRCSLRNA